MPIGRFSRMTRLSVKALRHYDEIGLLRPAWVDRSSSYRYYRLGQAKRAEAIRVLRQVGVPLEEIAELLDEEDPAIVAARLKEHRDRLVVQLAHQERMLRFLEKLIEREAGVVPYDVMVKEIEDQLVLATRKRTTLTRIGDDVRTGFGQLMDAIGAGGATPTGSPLVIYHDVIDEQTDGDIEMCVPVTSAVDLKGDVHCSTLAGGAVAFIVHQGPYEEIAPAYHVITGWVQEHGHQFTGPPREIYLNDPTLVAPEGILTEVQWPIG